jgi:hypothetical protein
VQKLIPTYPCENRVTFLDDSIIFEFWLDQQNTASPSITVIAEDVVDACDPGDWCSDYVAPDGRIIRGRIRAMTPSVSISSWQTAQEQPESLLIRMALS